MARWIKLKDMSVCPKCECNKFYIQTDGALRVFCANCRQEMNVSIASQSGSVIVE